MTFNIIILALLIIVVLGFLSWFLYFSRKKEMRDNEPKSIPVIVGEMPKDFDDLH